jgi:kynureninase
MIFSADQQFAEEMDRKDPIAGARADFYIPKTATGKDAVYFSGNSLGLQPKSVAKAITHELEDWQTMGVAGHTHARTPWLPYHEFVTQSLAELTGALPIEVVAMNTLTVNLHLMMISFYQPTQARHKIIIEARAFPSDHYAVESQIRLRGFDPLTSLQVVEPRPGERTLRTEDIERLLDESGEGIALVMLGGVNYYTGQLFDMARIARAGRAKGCRVAFDLAHAAGNVPLKLHDWGVDFACWCSYKYLNSGPGSVAGCFVHERHAHDSSLSRLQGWWGHDKKSRFDMPPDFRAVPGAEGWQLSNPPILSLAPVKASLEIFDKYGMGALREKSILLTGYLEFLLGNIATDSLEILTPRDEAQRGCQLSLVFKEKGLRIFDGLHAAGIVCDWREPDCIRVAPVPLYNTFMDVYLFVQALTSELNHAGMLSKGR